MRELSRIQKRFNLNRVWGKPADDVGNNQCHYYEITRDMSGDGDSERSVTLLSIQFQYGPRTEPNSVPGILDTDLLEIVRDRLNFFQNGPYATRENAIALTHVEEALLWMNKRVEDRAEAGKLGTTKV